MKEQDKISKLLRELGDALTEQYGTLPHDSRRSFSIRVGSIEVSALDSPNIKLIYNVSMEVDTSREERYG